MDESRLRKLADLPLSEGKLEGDNWLSLKDHNGNVYKIRTDVKEYDVWLFPKAKKEDAKVSKTVARFSKTKKVEWTGEAYRVYHVNMGDVEDMLQLKQFKSFQISKVIR